jgi:hypothetical protein
MNASIVGSVRILPAVPSEDGNPVLPVDKIVIRPKAAKKERQVRSSDAIFAGVWDVTFLAASVVCSGLSLVWFSLAALALSQALP